MSLPGWLDHENPFSPGGHPHSQECQHGDRCPPHPRKLVLCCAVGMTARGLPSGAWDSCTKKGLVSDGLGITPTWATDLHPRPPCEHYLSHQRREMETLPSAASSVSPATLLPRREQSRPLVFTRRAQQREPAPCTRTRAGQIWSSTGHQQNKGRPCQRHPGLGSGESHPHWGHSPTSGRRGMAAALQIL